MKNESDARMAGRKSRSQKQSPEDLFLRIHWAGIMNESVCTKGVPHTHVCISFGCVSVSAQRREFIYSNWPGPGVFSLFIPIDLAELESISAHDSYNAMYIHINYSLQLHPS